MNILTEDTTPIKYQWGILIRNIKCNNGFVFFYYKYNALTGKYCFCSVLYTADCCFFFFFFFCIAVTIMRQVVYFILYCTRLYFILQGSCNPSTSFSCGDNTCIPLAYRCDGVHDCLSEKDEDNCIKPDTCQEWWDAGYRENGIYKICKSLCYVDVVTCLSFEVFLYSFIYV